MPRAAGLVCGQIVRMTVGDANFRFVNGRHLEIFLTVNEFFSTKLKKKENL